MFTSSIHPFVWLNCYHLCFCGWTRRTPKCPCGHSNCPSITCFISVTINTKMAFEHPKYLLLGLSTPLVAPDTPLVSPYAPWPISKPYFCPNVTPEGQLIIILGSLSSGQSILVSSKTLPLCYAFGQIPFYLAQSCIPLTQLLFGPNVFLFSPSTVLVDSNSPLIDLVSPVFSQRTHLLFQSAFFQSTPEYFCFPHVIVCYQLKLYFIWYVLMN